MALSDITVSFNLTQLLGEAFDARRTRAYVKTNVANGTLMDTSTGEIRLGDQKVTIGDDGTGSFTTWAPGVDGNPTSWQTSLVVEYPRTGQRDRQVRTFGPYTIAASADLADLEEEQAVPAEYLTQVTDELQTYSDAAASSANAAQTARTGAEAARDEAQALVLSDLGTTDGQTAALIDNPLSQTASALSASTAVRTAANAKLFGALGDNAVNDTAFEAMLLEAKAARRPGTPGVSSDPLGSYVIEVPVGDFRVTDLQGMLGVENPGSKAVGLVFRGQGSSMTTVIFEPAIAGALMFNDYWLGLRFEGIRFVAATPGCTFMQSYTTNAAQDYTFKDCTWQGWKYVFDLQGNNNNSEFRFFGCANHTTEASGAFIYVGETNTSDQFLNYWFYGFKHWSTSAPIIDAARGGHFHFYGVDVSDYANGETTTTRHIFKLRGTTHAQGVCTMTVHGLRVEAKSAKAALLYSEWPQGDVTFYDTDWSSQSSVYTYEDVIDILYANVSGALYRFIGGQLSGGVKVQYGVSDWQHTHAITFERVTWLNSTNRMTPSEVVTYVATSGHGNTSAPPVHFIDCRNTYYKDGLGADGESVWSAVAGRDPADGWGGPAGATAMPRRSLSLRGIYGMLATSHGTLKVNLPLGAVITGIRALSPAGGTGSGATGASWSVKTTDAVPVTIATATVPGALSAGFDVTGAPATPYYCATRAQATVTITATGVDQNNAKGLLLLEGYW